MTQTSDSGIKTSNVNSSMSNNELVFEVTKLNVLNIGLFSILRAHGVVRTFRQRTETINGIRQIGADDCCNFQLEMDGGAFATVALGAHRGRFAQGGHPHMMSAYIIRC